MLVACGTVPTRVDMQLGGQQKCRTNWATRTLEESRLSATPQKRVPFATNVKGWRRTIEVNTSMTRNAKEMGTSDAYTEEASRN